MKKVLIYIAVSLLITATTYNSIRLWKLEKEITTINSKQNSIVTITLFLFEDWKSKNYGVECRDEGKPARELLKAKVIN